METMAFIRFLTDGELGHDLANPFKTAFIQCTKCDGTMLLDRDLWRAECMTCSYVEHDVPGMVVSRSDLSRMEACIAFELSKTADIFPLSNPPSLSKMTRVARSIKCTMSDVEEAHKFLIGSPFLKEALLLKKKISESDIVDKRIGAVVRDGVGLFLFPKIKMLSMVSSIDFVSMMGQRVVWYKLRCCDVLRRRTY